MEEGFLEEHLGFLEDEIGEEGFIFPGCMIGYIGGVGERESLEGVWRCVNGNRVNVARWFGLEAASLPMIQHS